MSPGPERRRIRVSPEREVAFVDEGEGPALFVLHGFTGSCDSVAGLAAGCAAGHAAGHSAGRRVVRVDLPGHGGTRVPADPAAHSMEACVADLEAVAEALGIQRCAVAGYSMGARAALAWAVFRPERVRALALVGARAGFADREAREKRIAADESLADRIEAQGLEWFVDHWMALPLFASQKRLGPEALARAREARLGADPAGLAASLRGMGAGAQPALHARLPELRARTLLLVGDEDERFRVEAHDLAGRIPDARVALIPEAGHAAHLENPVATVAAIDSFLDEVRS